MALHGKKPQTNQTIKTENSCSEGRKYLGSAMFLYAAKPSDHANGATGASARATSQKCIWHLMEWQPYWFHLTGQKIFSIN